MGNASLTQYYIECLRKDIEKEIGRSVSTYSDFDYLSLKLKDRIPDPPSVSTLKRLWAYVSTSSMRSRSTLNALSRFLGYNDWNQYIDALMRENRVESDFLTLSTISTTMLHPCDIIELTWNPGRRLKAEFLGGDRFEVKESENSKLPVGATFSTLIITKGLPLLCGRVMLGDIPAENYVAGTKSGITGLRYLPSKSKTSSSSSETPE